MNCLFIIFVIEFFYFYPKINICKILNCNTNYGSEYDLEMDKDEHFLHFLNFNYSNTNSSNKNIILRK